MVIIHFLAFATVSVLHSESMPSKPTQTPKEELRPFFTNLGTRMRANRFSLFPIYYWKRNLPFIACFLFLDLRKALLMNQLSKVTKALLGLLLAPFYLIEGRERDKKLRERLARLERKGTL